MVLTLEVSTHLDGPRQTIYYLVIYPLPGVEVVTPSAAVVVGFMRVSPLTTQGPRDEKLSTGLVSGSLKECTTTGWRR